MTSKQLERNNPLIIGFGGRPSANSKLGFGCNEGHKRVNLGFSSIPTVEVAKWKERFFRVDWEDTSHLRVLTYRIRFILIRDVLASVEVLQ